MPAFPTVDINLFYMTIYGGFGYDGCGGWGAGGLYGCQCSAFLGLASGLPQTGNPPYTVGDFLRIYPKFLGTPVLAFGVTDEDSPSVTLIGLNENFQPGQLVAGAGIPDATVISSITSEFAGFNGDTTSGSQIILNINDTSGLSFGQTVTGLGIPAGTVITGVGSDQITISLPATADGSDVPLQSIGYTLVLSNAATASGAIQMSIYTAPLVQLAVIQIYLNIAYVSLMSSRWREQWYLGMALYIAHYLTLWLETEGNPQTTAAQIVANSLQAGVTISQSADGVSQGIQALKALENWAAWSLTMYGVQLTTLARVVGAGPIYVRA